MPLTVEVEVDGVLARVRVVDEDEDDGSRGDDVAAVRSVRHGREALQRGRSE